MSRDLRFGFPVFLAAWLWAGSPTPAQMPIVGGKRAAGEGIDDRIVIRDLNLGLFAVPPDPRLERQRLEARRLAQRNPTFEWPDAGPPVDELDPQALPGLPPPRREAAPRDLR